MEFLVRKCRVDGLQYPVDYGQPCEVCLGDSWSFWCQKHSKPAEDRGCEDCAYKFAGHPYFEPRGLGAALFANWNLGKKEIARRRVSEWLLDSGGDRLLAGKLREVERDESISPDDRFSLIVMLLVGDGMVRWGGSIIDMAWFRREESAGLELLRGPIPTRLAEIGIATWLGELKKHWLTILSEVHSDTESERTAFGILFSPSKIRSLSTALSLTGLMPRLHLPDIWGRKSGTVASIAATISDSGFALPEQARLKQLFSAICRELSNGQALSLDNKAFYEATFVLAWRFDGKTLLEDQRFRDVLLAHLRKNHDSRLLKSLVFGYLRDFSLDKPGYIASLASLIREYLPLGNASEFIKWKTLDDSFELFAGRDAPSICGARLNLTGELESCLRTVGLVGSSLWEGFSAEMLLAWMRSRGEYRISDWPYMHGWFEKVAHSFVHRENEWIEAAVSAWIGKSSPGELRKVVARYMVDRFGEPAHDAPIWNRCPAPVRETVTQWLLFENLEKFFDLIADYAETTGGEMRAQWGYRKAFWLAVHRTGAVSDIRIAAGRGILKGIGQTKLQDRFGSKLARLDDSDDRRCALILRLKELTVVDFTHNAKCRVWRTGQRQERWFSSAELARDEFQNCQDMKIRAHYSETGISHFSSETYGWQDALAEFLRTNAAIRIVRSEFECR